MLCCQQAICTWPLCVCYRPQVALNSCNRIAAEIQHGQIPYKADQQLTNSLPLPKISDHSSLALLPFQNTGNVLGQVGMQGPTLYKGCRCSVRDLRRTRVHMYNCLVQLSTYKEQTKVTTVVWPLWNNRIGKWKSCLCLVRHYRCYQRCMGHWATTDSHTYIYRRAVQSNLKLPGTMVRSYC